MQHSGSNDDPIKQATVEALQRVLEPLITLMLDAGLTVPEFNQMLRERAVRIATNRVVKQLGRESKSRVSIITGLPRSEVTKIMDARNMVPKEKPSQHPARRVLAAWFDDPRFAEKDGNPAILPIFGKKKSFEQLVIQYGAGLPVRAMLDELVQIDGVECLADQRLRVKARNPILTGLNQRSIAAVGERGKDLLETLIKNVREKSQPLFEATAVMDEIELDMVSLARREIAEQGASFINGATSLLNRFQLKKGKRKIGSPSNPCRIGVSVFYFQDDNSSRAGMGPAKAKTVRRNLKRRKVLKGHHYES